MHSYWRLLLAGSVAGLGISSATCSAVAQQRSWQGVESQPAPQSVVAPMQGIQLFFGAEGGYDSNLDNKVAKEASRYEMIQAGLTGNFKASDTESYTLYARGRNYWYNDLDVSNRYDVDVALGARYDFSKQTTLKSGISWLRDAIPINVYDSFRAFGDLVNEGADYRVRLKLDSRTDLGFRSDETIGLLDPDVFSVSRSRAFDFTKNGATASVLLLRQQVIAPFLIGNFTNIEYFHQDPNPAIDRRANEYWAVAGVRVTLSPTLYVDLGARYNNRDTEDKIFPRFDSTYFDGRLSWKLTDSWSLTGVIERQIKEPTTSFGVADDVTTYELSTNYKSGSWTLFAKTFLDRVRPVGDTFDYSKYNWSVGAINELSKSVDVYADYSGRYVSEKINDEAYTRHRIGAGFRIKY